MTSVSVAEHPLKGTALSFDDTEVEVEEDPLFDEEEEPYATVTTRDGKKSKIRSKRDYDGMLLRESENKITRQAFWSDLDALSASDLRDETEMVLSIAAAAAILVSASTAAAVAGGDNYAAASEPPPLEEEQGEQEGILTSAPEPLICHGQHQQPQHN